MSDLRTISENPSTDTMSKGRALLLKRGNSIAVANYLGVEGELVVDSDNYRLYYHDGKVRGVHHLT